MLMVNTLDVPIPRRRIPMVGPADGEIMPGETVEVPDGYCYPQVAVNGSREPSIVERHCRGLKPADPEMRRRIEGKSFEPPVPKTDPVAELQAAGTPPAVAELIAAGQVEEAQPQRKRKGRKPQLAEG